MSSPSPALSPATAPERSKNTLLLLGGWFSLAFAVFQISGVFWPPKAIAYFGGPAQMSMNQPVLYAALCVVVGLFAAAFGFYALSGVGVVRRLPLLRTGIGVIAAIYLLRGLLLIQQMPTIIKHPGLWRFALFSMISLCVGVVHLAGLVKLMKCGRPGEAASQTD